MCLMATGIQKQWSMAVQFLLGAELYRANHGCDSVVCTDDGITKVRTLGEDFSYCVAKNSKPDAYLTNDW